MIEANQIKVDPHAAAAVKGNRKMSRTKGSSTQNYIWLWIRTTIATGTTADCCQAKYLRPGIQAQYLLADRSYDSQAILQTAHQAEMLPVIAPKKDRKYQRNDNQD